MYRRLTRVARVQLRGSKIEREACTKKMNDWLIILHIVRISFRRLSDNKKQYLPVPLQKHDSGHD